MLSRFIFKQIIAPDMFLQIIVSDDFLFANHLFRSLSVTHFVNCHQGRRVASILERRCGSEDESRTIWPHAFHIWSCSEASVRRFWGIKVFSFVKWTLCGTDDFNSTTQAKWFTEGDNQRSCQSSAIKVNRAWKVFDFSHFHLSRSNDHIGGYAVASPIFAGIESKFGLRFPKYREGLIWMMIWI